MNTENRPVSFIGLGVMGEPMCSNLLTKSGLSVAVFDLNPVPVKRLAAAGATIAPTLADAARASVIFLSLPGGAQVEACLRGPDGLLANARPGTIIVDLSTSPVELTRQLGAEAANFSITLVDAPVARTRQAAIDGTLSIMVGADDQTFARVEPLLRCMASDVAHCGALGSGQVVKILNNMVLFQTVVALSEAMAVGTRAGVDRAVLFQTMAKGSADSFALRNHGMKSIVANDFPKGAFSANYALKDVSYALELAENTGFHIPGAELAKARLEKAVASGFAESYFPVISQLVDKRL